MTDGAIIGVEINSQFVLTKCDYFLEVQLWPLHNKLDPNGWLSNFKADEMNHAVHLLQAFIYLSQPFMEQLFLTAVQSLSQRLRRPGESFLSTKAAWNSFLDNVIITRVTGELPNDTDSSFQFARMARQILEIPQDRIMGPDSALQLLYDGGPRPVIFVDDFVGSGEQFITTWHRGVELNGSIQMSFEKIARLARGAEFFYCPLLCTEYGQQEILRECQVDIYPAHFLPSKYSAVASDSVIWPDHLKSSASDFIYQASMRAGIPTTEWQGFHNLALTIAFDYGPPDATLPIFYWNKDNWKPLIEKK